MRGIEEDGFFEETRPNSAEGIEMGAGEGGEEFDGAGGEDSVGEGDDDGGGSELASLGGDGATSGGREDSVDGFAEADVKALSEEVGDGLVALGEKEVWALRGRAFGEVDGVEVGEVGGELVDDPGADGGQDLAVGRGLEVCFCEVGVEPVLNRATALGLGEAGEKLERVEDERGTGGLSRGQGLRVLDESLRFAGRHGGGVGLLCDFGDGVVVAAV